MRWKCPHCEIELSAANEQVSAEWSFSKCCQCSGFALIRLPRIELIRTGEPPSSENYIETSSVQPPTLIKPVVRQPASRSSAPLPDPLPTTIPPLPRKSRTPQILASVCIVSVISGAFLFQIHEKASTPSARMTDPAAPADRVPETTQAAQAPQLQPLAVVDQIEQKAMAPERLPQAEDTPPAVAQLSNPEPTLIEGKQTVSVTIRDPEVNLRTGPGLTYPVIGKAQEGESFQVIDWEDQWLKVQIENPKIAASDTAWLKKNRANLVLKNDRVAATH